MPVCVNVNGGMALLVVKSNEIPCWFSFQFLTGNRNTDTLPCHLSIEVYVIQRILINYRLQFRNF